MIDPKAFDDLPDGKKNFRVHLVVQPSGDNPWRTKEDYLKDQRMMNMAFRWTVASSLAAIASALTAIVAVVFSK